MHAFQNKGKLLRTYCLVQKYSEILEIVLEQTKNNLHGGEVQTKMRQTPSRCSITRA